jgi:hypothetical protein
MNIENLSISSSRGGRFNGNRVSRTAPVGAFRRNFHGQRDPVAMFPVCSHGYGRSSKRAPVSIEKGLSFLLDPVTFPPV